MAVYITSDYYQVTYGGTAVAAAEFTNRAIGASAIIDRLTFDRVAPIMALEGLPEADTATIEKIKLATCAVMDEYQQSVLRLAEAGAIKSESIGSHSVTYQDVPRPGQPGYFKQFSAPAELHLAGTGLMFGGFYEDEYGLDAV